MSLSRPIGLSQPSFVTLPHLLQYYLLILFHLCFNQLYGQRWILADLWVVFWVVSVLPITAHLETMPQLKDMVVWFLLSWNVYNIVYTKHTQINKSKTDAVQRGIWTAYEAWLGSTVALSWKPTNVTQVDCISWYALHLSSKWIW